MGRQLFIISVKMSEGRWSTVIFRAVASNGQTAQALTSATFFSVSVLLFVVIVNTLNTWEDNFTMDNASVIIFSGNGPDFLFNFSSTLVPDTLTL